MRRGAYDYITKPAEPEQVEAIVRKAFDKRKLILQNEKLRTAVRHQNENASVKPVHESASMKEIISQASKVAGLDTTILITGDSGTGKDVLARWIHAEGHRREFPLITVNCGALPENLFESEFFGFEKGAFTGAMKQKIGLIEAADGSTLFLDEIGEMPMTMQVKLLNFLESGRVRRVGATRDKTVDVRIIAATNKNLPQQVRDGKFRDDLFYRLNIIAFDLPSLRERMADVPILIDFFLKQLGQKYNRAKLRLSDSARNKLMNHNWLGNIRELKNTLERTVALSSGELIKEIYGLATQSLKPTQPGSQNEPNLVSLAEVEKKHILNVLESADGKREKAASILGITSRTLYRKLKEYSSE
jgi:DNA-binding NtrC family response regulator